MRSMILTADAEVYGKPQRAGYRFDATDKEARLWETLGRARSAEPRHVAADLQPEQPDHGRAEPRRGRYGRRDLRAQG